MLDVVNSVVEKVGITPDQADGALRIIINFLHADGPSETVASMAQELGIAHYIGEATPRGGLLGALGGLLGSGGGAMAAFGQLQSLGLNFGQIQAVVRHLIDIGRNIHDVDGDTHVPVALGRAIAALDVGFEFYRETEVAQDLLKLLLFAVTPVNRISVGLDNFTELADIGP